MKTPFSLERVCQQCRVCSESGRGDAVWRQAVALTTK